MYYVKKPKHKRKYNGEPYWPNLGTGFSSLAKCTTPIFGDALIGWQTIGIRYVLHKKPTTSNQIFII